MASMMPSESPTPHPNSNFSDFIYPGAQTVSQTSAILSLQSSDDTQTIINWYQAKINGNYSERSDNVSNTNGNVSALLSASNSSENINITITKSAKELYTYIQIIIK